MPWFRAGFQERIASAMLCGAVSLTDTSDYIEENFLDGHNIALYSLKELDKLPSIIHKLLNEPSYAQQIAQNGYLESKSHHTWSNRVDAMIQMINEYDFIRKGK
jgi:spore maturation protein CgeB